VGAKPRVRQLARVPGESPRTSATSLAVISSSSVTTSWTAGLRGIVTSGFERGRGPALVLRDSGRGLTEPVAEVTAHAGGLTVRHAMCAWSDLLVNQQECLDTATRGTHAMSVQEVQRATGAQTASTFSGLGSLSEGLWSRTR